MLWSGPGVGPPGWAAGVAAGLAALEALPEADWTMTLACDMPKLARAVPLLLAAARAAPGTDGRIGVTPDDRRQPLVALYRTEALRAAYADQDPADRSVRSLIHDLLLQGATVAENATTDVDT